MVAYTFNSLSEEKINIERAALNEESNYTYYTLLDGLSSGVVNYLSQVYNSYGIDVNYLGAGAGFLSLEQKECVFSNKGFFKDSAVSVIIETKTSIGVKHGWDVISEPLIVTKSKGNLIENINWKPAFSVYKGIVEEHSGKQLDKNNFFDLAKCYPFGLSKENEELIVRDPIITDDDNSIMCVGDINENTFVTILNGKKDKLIIAAEDATIKAINNSSDFKSVELCFNDRLYLSLFVFGR